MGIVGLLIVGLIAGFLARLVVPGKDSLGLLGTILLGIAGAFVGGFLARALTNDNDGVGLFGATVGAIICLLVYRKVAKR